MRSLNIAIAAMILIAGPSNADAYETETHREIAIRAAQPKTASLDDVLKKELGVREGVGQVLSGQGKSIDRLIGEGAFFEDSPVIRVRNHFHNPLFPWDAAGLRILGIQLGQSSVIWQQNRDQDSFFSGGGNWSWQDARHRYLSALTGIGLRGNTKEARDEALADTFFTLGHLTHLIQDASVPAHTRNDQHVVFEGYEAWAERARRNQPPGEQAFFTGYLASPVRPPASIFSPGRPEAPIPIARLIDSDKFNDPTNFGALLDPALGIAEYSNGNFLSDDTIFQDFALPRQQSLDLGSPFLEPVGAQFQRYFPKIGEGETITHFVAESALYRDASESAGQPISDALTLTRVVYRDYGARLLPRAVGYSAALLDYFFRGRLEASIEPDPDDSQGLLLTAKNTSPEALDGGTLEIYGDSADDTRTQMGSWANIGPIAPGYDVFTRPAGFRPPVNQPIPSRYMVVYKGDLGSEKKHEDPDPAKNFVGGVIGKAVNYGAIIEELVLFRDGAVFDVYFRNDQQVTRLNVSPFISPSTFGADSVRWGRDGNTFFVRSYEAQMRLGGTRGWVPLYDIFRLSGQPNAVRGAWTVSAEYVKTIRPPTRELPYLQVRSTEGGGGSRSQTIFPFDTGLGQEVLSEEFESGGLEIYGVGRALILETIELSGGPNAPASSNGYVYLPLILKASTGDVVYEDPVARSYVDRIQGAVSRGALADAGFGLWAETTMLSWSDVDVTKRRWFTAVQADEQYRTFQLDNSGRVDGNTIRPVIQDASFESAVIEGGAIRSRVDALQPYRSLDANQPARIAQEASCIPTLSSQRYLAIDKPDRFRNDDDYIGMDHRTVSILDIETGRQFPVALLSLVDSSAGTFQGIPKAHQLVMLQPGLLYAFDESPESILLETATDADYLARPEETTLPVERQKLIRFLDSGENVDPTFLTSLAGLQEDPDIKGKGRVLSRSVPAEFQTILNRIPVYRQSYDSALVVDITWQAVLDPDFVPARRR